MIECQKKLFSLNNNDTYLNCAYMAPLLRSTEKVGISGIKQKNNPIDINVDDFFQTNNELRAAFCELINAENKDYIFPIPSVSYGMAIIAKNLELKPNEKILIIEEQFPSNYYSWKRLCDENSAQLITIKKPISDNSIKDWNEEILNAIDETVRLVALPHIHWADGSLFDLVSIRNKTLEMDSLLCIDGTQSVGALPFDIQKIRPDALVCAGYKWLLGPYSFGLAYFGKKFENGIPIEENWINRLNSEDFENLINYNLQYKDKSLRFGVGEQSNFILAPMLLDSIRQILKWKTENIQSYCKNLFDNAIEELKEHDYIIKNLAYRSAHLFGIKSSNTDRIEKIKNKLIQNRISVSIRGKNIRVAPHLYNTEEDVKKFTDLLISIK